MQVTTGAPHPACPTLQGRPPVCVVCAGGRGGGGNVQKGHRCAPQPSAHPDAHEEHTRQAPTRATRQTDHTTCDHTPTHHVRPYTMNITCQAYGVRLEHRQGGTARATTSPRATSKAKSETRPRPKVGRPAGQAATKRHDARDRGAYRSELQRRGGWAVDSGVKAHGQSHRTARLGSGGCLAVVGLARVSRGQRTGKQGPGRLPGNRRVRPAGRESRERARGVPRDGRPGEGWMSTTAAGDGPPRGGRTVGPTV